MNSEALLQAIGDLPEGLIYDARPMRRKTVPLRRIAVLAAALALCLALIIPAAAGGYRFYEALYAVSPTVAQTLRPVQLNCEDQGIEMEVISANIHGDSADIYIALRDLTGDRVDESTDLFDSYSIDRDFDCSATCQLVAYEADTKTATFLIQLTQWNDAEIRGKKLSFSLSRLLSRKADFDGSLGIGLAGVSSVSGSAAPGELRGCGGNAEYVEQLEKSGYLAAAEGGICSPVPGVTVNAIGYIDGRLHVQICYADIRRTDNHGYPYLLDTDGQRIIPAASVSFFDAAHIDSYEEYLFDLSPAQAESCTLCGYFQTGGLLTEGKWSVTFPLTGE